MLLHYSINIANACVTQWVSTHNRHSIHMEQCEINVKINAVSVVFPRHSMFGIINMQLIVVFVWFGPTLHRKLIEISWETKKLLPNRQIEFPIAQFFFRVSYVHSRNGRKTVGKKVMQCSRRFVNAQWQKKKTANTKQMVSISRRICMQIQWLTGTINWLS